MKKLATGQILEDRTRNRKGKYSRLVKSKGDTHITNKCQPIKWDQSYTKNKIAPTTMNINRYLKQTHQHKTTTTTTITITMANNRIQVIKNKTIGIKPQL